MSFAAMRLLVALLVLASAVYGDEREIKYCFPYNPEEAVLRKCSEVMSQASNAELSFSCIGAASPTACMRKVSDGDADITTLQNGDIYDGWTKYGLRPILSEDDGKGFGVAAWTVAVVPEYFCGNNGTGSIESLKGMRMCSAGYGTAAGWSAPVGYLLSHGVMPVVNLKQGVNTDAESAVDFFGGVCAPSSDTSAVNAESGENVRYDQLCHGCPDECNDQQMYSGNEGALHCLFEEENGVAFTIYRAVEDKVAEGYVPEAWSKSVEAYRLLCPSGACQEIISDVSQCNWGKIPTAVIAARPSYTTNGDEEYVGNQIQNAMMQLSYDWFRTAVEVGTDHKKVIASDAAYLWNAVGVDVIQNAEQADEAVGMTDERQRVNNYVDPVMLDSFKAINDLDKAGRFCVVNEAELDACNKLIKVLKDYDSSIKWGCVMEYSVAECLQQIATGSAEMRLVDPSEMYTAREKYSLAPLVSEYYAMVNANGDRDNFAVVVVDEKVCEGNKFPSGIPSIRGKSVCYSGYEKDEWWMLLDQMVKIDQLKYPKDKNSPDVAADAYAIEKFFNKVCAPGTSMNGPLQGGQSYSPLCELCKDNCTTASPYYGRQGAMWCLAETEAELAVTSQAEAGRWTMKDGQMVLRENGEESSFRLLCPYGGCTSVDDFEACNMGRIKANAIVTDHMLYQKASIKNALVTISKDQDQLQKVLDTGFFSHDTVSLMPVDTTMRQYLGEQFAVYDQLYQEGWTGNGEALQRPVGDIKFCIPDNAVEESDVRECTRMLSQADDVMNGITFSCIKGNSMVECMSMVANKTADMVTLDGQDQFYALKTYALMPSIAIQSSDNYSTGYAVAVVKRDFCERNPNATLANLRGLDACFTGYGKFGGWLMPVGQLYNDKLLQSSFEPSRPVVRTDAQAITSFFASACAPGLGYEGPVLASNGSVSGWENLCKDCPTMDTGNCYWGLEGFGETKAMYGQAMRCLQEGNRNVAFTIDKAANEFTKDSDPAQPWAYWTKDEMRLLCPSGGCKLLTESSECNLGAVPGAAIVVREYTPALAQLAYKAMGDVQWLQNLADFGGVKGFPWPTNTVGLEMITDITRRWGNTAINNLRGRYELNRPNVTWCVETVAKFNRCVEMLDQMNKAQLHVTFSCHFADAGSCSNAIKQNMADMALVDPYDVYTAQADFGLKAVASEVSRFDDQYYSVAVVRKEMCDQSGFSLNSLKRKNLCSSGYRRSAGWILPMGFMLIEGNMGYISEHDDTENDAETVVNYFDRVCAPGTNMNGPVKGDDNSTGKPSWKLCTACNNNGDCTETNPYYDDDGAMQCFMEGKGDVAFLRHQTPLNRAKDGYAPLEWSNLNTDEMRIMCPRRTGCANLDAFEDCTFGKVPPRAVITRPDYPDVRRLTKALMEITASEDFYNSATNATADAGEALFLAETWGFAEVDDTLEYLGKTAVAYDGFRYLDSRQFGAGAGRK